MGKGYFIAIVLVVTLAIPVLASTPFAQFVGTWQNVDPNTQGMTTVTITVQGNEIWVRVFVRCQPHDCHWGEVRATAYARNPGDNPRVWADTISAVFRTSVQETFVIIDHARDPRPMEVRALTQFTDNSGRSNYQHVYRFQRVPAR